MASVSLEGVTKVYPGSVKALANIDLEIDDHEFVVIVGPSASGKTTTLRLIAGLEEVSSGQVRIGDRAVNRVIPKDRNIAMVFQSFDLYPHLSVYQNMAFGLRLRYGGGRFGRFVRRMVRPARAAQLAALRKGIKQQVQQAAKLLGIEHLLSRMPRHLSGGERQRVALGRAIVRDPAAFLFDEPFSNLDLQLRSELRSELKQLHERLNTTIVYVTHDQAEAMTLGQRVVVIDKGRIQQVGKPMEVYDRPNNRFVAEFIGSPAMNFAAGQLRQNQGQWSFFGPGLNVNLKRDWSDVQKKILDRFVDHDIVLGIRPKDIELQAAEPNSDVTRIEGCVADVEALGDSTIFRVETDAEGEKTVACKMSGRSTLRRGESINLTFNTQHVHLFDPQTGNNILHAQP